MTTASSWCPASARSFAGAEHAGGRHQGRGHCQPYRVLQRYDSSHRAHRRVHRTAHVVLGNGPWGNRGGSRIGDSDANAAPCRSDGAWAACRPVPAPVPSKSDGRRFRGTARRLLGVHNEEDDAVPRSQHPRNWRPDGVGIGVLFRHQHRLQQR